MKLEHYIAKKVGFGKGNTFTKVIMRIAVISIAVSLAVMIVTTALITGFKQQITEKIFGFWGHIHITDSNVSLTREPKPMDISLEFYQQLKDVEAVEYQKPLRIGGWELPFFNQHKTEGGVSHAHSFALAPGIISTKKEFEGIVVKGVGPDFDWDRMKPYIKEGEPLNLNSNDSLPSDQIMISKKTASRLKLEVGSKLIMHFIDDGNELKRRFQVKGIYNTGLGEYDKKFAIADIRQVKEVYGWSKDQVGGLEIFVDDLDDMNILSEYIYYTILPANLYAETIREKFPNIFEWLSLQDINEVVILCLMIIVSIINMITALLILILERTKMIGVLKALGSNNWSIRKIFLYHAFYIISRGLIYGTLLGVGVCLLQKYTEFIKLDEANYYLSVAPIELNVLTVVLLNLGTLIVTLIFLILPTFLITRIDPVKVLRFE